ncbi:MAG: DNA recombination protein RmuC [Methylococcales bacterium]
MSESIILSPFWSGLLIGACGVLVCCALVIWRLLGVQKRKFVATHLEMEQVFLDKQDLKSNLGLAEQQIANLENQRTRLDQELHDRAQRIEGLQNEVTHLRTSHFELSTRLEEERIRAGERLEAIQNAERQMIHHFESLGAKILEEKSKRFSEQNQANLDRLLSPLREQLGEFRKKVDEVYVTDSKDRAALREAIRNLNLENQRIGQEANNLVRALKGDKKAQGTWGELVLERVLEQSGLRKGIEYEAQGGFRDADNRLLKPDVIVHLPEARDNHHRFQGVLAGL